MKLSRLQFGVLFVIIFAFVQGKDCDCGILCSKHKGYENLDNDQEKCFFVADKNNINGEYIQIKDIHEEKMIVDNLLKGITVRQNLSIDHNPKYKMTIFKQTCIPSMCTHAVFQTKCHCKLNIFEKIYEKIKFFYHNFNSLFWIIISLVLGSVFFALLKCIICRRCHK